MPNNSNYFRVLDALVCQEGRVNYQTLILIYVFCDLQLGTKHSFLIDRRAGQYAERFAAILWNQRLHFKADFRANRQV